MTAFTTADLPPSINTVEKLIVWGLTLKAHVDPLVKTIEETGKPPQLIYSAGAFDLQLASGADWTYQRPSRFIGRVSIPLDALYKTGKWWDFAEETSTIVIPAQFKP